MLSVFAIGKALVERQRSRAADDGAVKIRKAIMSVRDSRRTSYRVA